MSKGQRIKNVIMGLFMLLAAAIIIVDESIGFGLILGILGITFVVSGLAQLLYYFTMARHMVSGKTIMIKGIITIDVGFFSLFMVSSAQLLIICYILGCHLVAGVIDILSTVESKRMGAPSWKFKLTYGIVNIAISVICVICALGVGNLMIVVYLYSMGLAYSALVKIVSAFRRTSMVYIQ